MIVKDVKKCIRFTALDGTDLCELMHPERGGPDLPYSLAHALLKPGQRSLPHRLKKSSETYYILEGEGLMHIDADHARVHSGQAVFIPPGSWQYIENTGTADLKFLAIVYPMWCSEDEELA